MKQGSSTAFPQKSLVTRLLYQGEWPPAVLQRGFRVWGLAVINAIASPGTMKRTSALHTPALPLDAR